MGDDIRAILDKWDFEPGQFQARVIEGSDGREKIQLRIDLGLLQMELSGRPDGQRPKGLESWLDFYEVQARRAAASGTDFSLDSSDCVLLMQEGLQYYHRYLSAFHLGRYELVARDTERNLRLFAFVVRHAAREEEKMEFDQYRPYVEMMHARARASQSLLAGDHRAALAQIDDGIAAIRRFLRDHHQEKREGQCRELRFLVRWRRDVAREQSRGPIEQLEQQLAVSIELEHYEEAARIRDQIRRLQAEGGPCEGGPVPHGPRIGQP